MKLTKSVFVLLSVILSTAVCENCVTYDFGTEFNSTFNHGRDICEGMASWTLGRYSDSGVAAPHADSDSFISPGQGLSCVSSYTFEMRSTGILEVNIYMEALSPQDQIVVLAKEITSSSYNNAVTGTSMLTPLSTSYKDGWHVMRIELFGTGNFDGYVTFLGITSPGSTIIVDSFRYIPPLYEDNCYLYDETFVAPTAPPQLVSECVTYDFEELFDDKFNADRGLCTGFTQWTLEEYSSISTDSPSEDSYKHISPQSHLSCISSFNFNIRANGILEINVYMESNSTTDQIAVLANQVLDDNNDAVTGSAVLTPLHGDYADGWQILRIHLVGQGTYNGYISFLGMASEDSIVLIDSFRYIPPDLDENECNIYNEQETTTEIPSSTAEPNGEECITYNFERNFDKIFDMNNQLCNGYTSWNLGTYYSLTIDSIFPESSTFISPNSSSSCISSFVFEMKPGGTVEVNVFMKSLSDLDYVIVLAKKVMPDGTDTVAGFELYYANNSDFVEGWNVLKVSVLDFRAFNGYITLIGSMAEDSIVLIDSFRYIPPNTDEPCNIY